MPVVGSQCEFTLVDTKPINLIYTIVQKMPLSFKIKFVTDGNPKTKTNNSVFWFIVNLNEGSQR